jgi:hypothetical protein
VILPKAKPGLKEFREGIKNKLIIIFIWKYMNGQHAAVSDPPISNLI